MIIWTLYIFSCYVYFHKKYSWQLRLCTFSIVFFMVPKGYFPKYYIPAKIMRYKGTLPACYQLHQVRWMNNFWNPIYSISKFLCIWFIVVWVIEAIKTIFKPVYFFFMKRFHTYKKYQTQQKRFLPLSLCMQKIAAFIVFYSPILICECFLCIKFFVKKVKQA